MAPRKKHAKCMKPEKVGTVLLLVPWPVQRCSSASNEVTFRDATPNSNFDMINISQLSNVLEMPGAGELDCNCVGNSTSEHLLLSIFVWTGASLWHRRIQWNRPHVLLVDLGFNSQ